MKVYGFLASFWSLNLSSSKHSLEDVITSGYSPKSFIYLVYPDIKLLINSKNASLISKWLNISSSSGSANFLLKARSTYCIIKKSGIIFIHSVALFNLYFNCLNSFGGSCGT